MSPPPPSTASTAASVSGQPFEAQADVLDGACVVVVDDEPANVILVERILRSVGVRHVHGVTDPRQAVQRCVDVNADLVLLDLHMPGRDGFAVLADLHAAVPTDAFLPVLVLTADATVEIRNRALGAGATDFLTKPLDRLEVILRVRNLLQTRALHVDVQTRNAALTAELVRRQAAEQRADTQYREHLARVDAMLQRRDYHMAFQPVADLATGTIVGVEALTRFTGQPSRPPNVWFDQARTVGRSHQLEIATITAALADLDRLPDDAFLAVNVSHDVATRGELAGLLADVPPGRIVLELTEHTRVESYTHLLAGLQPLRGQGVRIAVDDAGAGYSGLTHVLRLQPDLVKLDIDLIRDIDRDPAKRALTTALVTFAKETGATIIAEGIETAAELLTLQTLGVSWGQGYHLARPAPLPLSDTIHVANPRTVPRPAR